MKVTAIKIVSGVLVVALVVIAALAIAGVFGVKTVNTPDIALAENDPSVTETQMFRGFAADTVLYIKATNGGSLVGSTEKYISVVDNQGDNVVMVWQNSGVKPKDGWTPGMYYRVSLSAGYEFVNEEYAGRSSFDCIVASRESTDKDIKLSDNVIVLKAGAYTIDKNAIGDAYTLVVDSYDTSIQNPVFVEDLGEDVELTERYNAYKMDAGSVVKSNGGAYVFTVIKAEQEDVYDEFYLNKSYSIADEDFNSWQVDYDATEASIRSSDWYLAAVDAVYGTGLDTEKKNDKVKISFTPGFEAGSPSKIKLDIVLKFTGLLKDNSGSIQIKLANVFIPVFDVHIQNEDGAKAFDAALNLDVETTASVECSYAKSFSSDGDDANATLMAIAEKVASAVQAATGKQEAGKPHMFAKWIIPIGALPICIEDNLGVELKASFGGKVGVSVTNRFHTEVGVVYNSKAEDKISGFGNVDDQFHFEGIGLLGTAGVKVGLVNEIGISAYGTIAIDLGLHAGVYCDLSGRLQLEGDDIIKLFTREGGLNIVPAYYLEAGIYVDLDVSGKLFTFTIAQKTLLAKKFPLYTLGHKYLPMSWVEDEETIYMESSYYYINGWDVNAKHIQDIASAASAMNLEFGEFDYEVGDGLRLDGNRLVAIKAGAFESYIKVTSKVNKQLSKTVVIVKNPEQPTASKTEVVFDKNKVSDVYYNVMLNGSKLIGISIDGSSVNSFDPLKDYTEGSLKIAASVASKLSVGAHKVSVESSKGYLDLVLRVINSAEVIVDTADVQYDKAASGAVQWKMVLQGNAIASVEVDGAELDAKDYSYRESEGKFVINASYWDGKEVGAYDVKVTLANDKAYDLKVNVVDNRKVNMLSRNYVYVYGSEESIEIKADLYANEISFIEFDGGKINTTEATIDSGVLATKAIGSYKGYINGDQSLWFDVNVVKGNNALIIPVQSGEFYKSQNNDVTFQVKKMASGIKIANCEYTVGSDSITISGSFLAKQSGEEWSGIVTGADNEITLKVALINDLKPALLQSEYTISGSENVQVKWDLQGYDRDTFTVEGVGDYKKTADYLQITGSDLAYGTTYATIYTPVNALTFSITRSGTPSFKTASYALNKNSDSVVSYELDVAHLAFSYLTVEGADILPIQYRYSDGQLTLSNDFAYNLAAGEYKLNAYLSDGSALQATLKIQGEASVTDLVGAGSSDSPYLIFTADQLANVYTTVNSSNISTNCYRLMADIDMYGYSVEPIGTKDRPYNGVFDGNGYTISNMTITKTVKMDDDEYAIGMFGVIGASGKVSNLVLTNANVSFTQNGSVNAGIVAGCNKGIITGVYITGSSISAETKKLSLKNAYFELGGVVGYNYGGTIKNVDISANITANLKGLNVLGVQVLGRKSMLSIGGVVGNFTTANGEKLVSNVKGNVSVKSYIDNGNEASINGWYGYTDLDEETIADCAKRCKVAISK